MNMEKAIKIVEGFIARLNRELDENRASYARTKADSIFDADYRRMLENIHNRTMSKLIVLEDVKRALDVAMMDEEAKA